MEVSGQPHVMSALHPGKELTPAGNWGGPIACLDVFVERLISLAGIQTMYSPASSLAIILHCYPHSDDDDDDGDDDEDSNNGMQSFFLMNQSCLNSEINSDMKIFSVEV
jgi:hypothetical protein